MKRILASAGLVLLGLALSARSAEAGIVDWMQGWSGPGPFNQHLFPVTIGCLEKPSFDITKGQDRCSFIDFRRLRTDKEDNKFPIPVEVYRIDVGFSKSLRVLNLYDSLQAGAGVGVMWVQGEKSQGGKEAVRMTITAPRIVIKPVVALSEIIHRGDAEKIKRELIASRKDLTDRARASLPAAGVSREPTVPSEVRTLVNTMAQEQWAEKSAAIDADIMAAEPLYAAYGLRENPSLKYRWANVLKIYIAASVNVGRLRAQDLCTNCVSNYDRTNELVLSRGFFLDLAELIPASWRSLKRQ